MTGILEDEGPGLDPLSAGAFLLTAALAVGIAWNALMNQQGGTEVVELPPGGTTHMAVSPPDASRGTITLRFDPEVEDLQSALASAGYYTGPIDGVAGRRTRTAIEAFQAANGLDITGQASPELTERVRFAKQIADAAGITSSVAPSNVDESEILRTEQGLSELGYAPGSVDGTLDDQTREAIRAFERDHGLPETGGISDALVNELSGTAGQSTNAEQ